VHAYALQSYGNSGMKDNLGGPIGTRYLSEQMKLIEEAASALKIQPAKLSGLALLSMPSSF